MRKLILATIATAIAASIVPASAETGNGCQVIGGETDVAGTCEYVSTGADTSILVLTPNAVKVTYVNGDGETVTAYSNASADPAAQGAHSVDVPAGPVKVTVGPDSAEVVEGWIGIVAISETA